MPAAKRRTLLGLLVLALAVATTAPAAASIPRPTHLDVEPAALLAEVRAEPVPTSAAPEPRSFTLFDEAPGDRFELLDPAAVEVVLFTGRSPQPHLFPELETRLGAIHFPGWGQHQEIQWFEWSIVVGEGVGPNLYQYALNDPVNLTDPIGLATWTLGPFSMEVPDEVDARVKQEAGRVVGAANEIYDQARGLYELSKRPGGFLGQLAENYGVEGEYLFGIAIRLNETCGLGMYERCMVERDLVIQELGGHLWETSRGLPVVHSVEAGIDVVQAEGVFDRGFAEGTLAVRAVEDLLAILGLRAGWARGSTVPGGAPEELITVSRWGREGLQPGDFVMKGPVSRTNYVLSGKWQPGFGNQYAPFRLVRSLKFRPLAWLRPARLLPRLSSIEASLAGLRRCWDRGRIHLPTHLNDGGALVVRCAASRVRRLHDGNELGSLRQQLHIAQEVGVGCPLYRRTRGCSRDSAGTARRLLEICLDTTTRRLGQCARTSGLSGHCCFPQKEAVGAQMQVRGD